MSYPAPVHAEDASSVRRSKKTLRTIAVLICGLLLAAGAFCWIGPPLQPWDDLKPSAIPPLPAGMKNGREFLQTKWKPLPESNGGWWSGDKLDLLQESVIPWDDADPEMTSAAKRGEDRLAELKEALAMPGWRMPDYPRVDDQYSDRIHLITALNELSALIQQQIHAGRMGDATEVILLLAETSRREITAASLRDRLEQGIQIRSTMLRAIPPFLAAATAREEAFCVKLQEACQNEPLTAARLKDCVLRDIESRCHDLLTLPLSQRIPEREWPASRSYNIGRGILKYGINAKATVNLFHNAFRAALLRFLAPVPDLSDSLQGLAKTYYVDQDSWLYFKLNGEGRRYVGDELISWDYFDLSCRRALFQQRAVAVAIALHRWRMTKGHWPAHLEELVPEYLPAIPSDPYDGKALRWVPAQGGLLYGLGSQWTDNPAKAFPPPDKDTGYFNREYEVPALRLELPARKSVPSGKAR